jgi:hypothetical protein
MQKPPNFGGFCFYSCPASQGKKGAKKILLASPHLLILSIINKSLCLITLELLRQ